MYKDNHIALILAGIVLWTCEGFHCVNCHLYSYCPQTKLSLSSDQQHLSALSAAAEALSPLSTTHMLLTALLLKGATLLL